MPNRPRTAPAPRRRPRRALLALGLTFLGVAGLVPLAPPGHALGAETAAGAELTALAVPAIVHPVDGTTAPLRARDRFGACRSGCSRSHEGIDLYAPRLTPLVAAASGRITDLRFSSGILGNMLRIRDATGWSYRYLHVNNDTPGTDDGANPPEWSFAPGIRPGARVTRGQIVGFMGDSGNAEDVGVHLHFEMIDPRGVPIDPLAAVARAEANRRCDPPAPVRPAATARGYWLVANDGEVVARGGVPDAGSMRGRRLNAAIVGIASTSTAHGYWLLAADGGIFSFGDARFHGSTGNRRLNAPVVAMAPTPTGHGYWLLGGDGGMFAFGDAGFHGSLPQLARCASTAIGIVPSATGRGYAVVGPGGRVYAFGDADPGAEDAPLGHGRVVAGFALAPPTGAASHR